MSIIYHLSYYTMLLYLLHLLTKGMQEGWPLGSVLKFGLAHFILIQLIVAHFISTQLIVAHFISTQLFLAHFISIQLIVAQFISSCFV